MAFLLDLINQLVRAVSFSVDSAAATVTGDYKDCDNILDQTYATFLTGEASGSPTSFTATFTLMESVDSSGTGATAVAGVSQVITADKTERTVRFERTKRYVAGKCVLAFVGGTSPKQDISAIIFGQKRSL